MHFHWQNLNEKPAGRTGSLLRHGRAWWHLGARDRERSVVAWEWVIGSARCAIGFTAHRGDGVGIQFSIAIPLLISFYLTLDGGIFSRIACWLLPKDGYENREISIRIFDRALWWSFWNDPMSWSSKTSKYRNGSWHPVDTFFGREKYSERELSSVDAIVPMPERSYPCKVTLREDSWKRPRWPFTKRLLRASVDMGDNPIPFPGKGENSWDCGEDATHSLSCLAGTVEEAIAAMVESVMRSRRRYGGSVNWKPEASNG